MPHSAMRSTFERIVINQFTPLHCAQAREMLGWNREYLSQQSGVSVPAIERFEAKPLYATLPGWPSPTVWRRKGWCSFPGLRPVAGAMFAALHPTRWAAKTLP